MTRQRLIPLVTVNCDSMGIVWVASVAAVVSATPTAPCKSPFGGAIMATNTALVHRDGARLVPKGVGGWVRGPTKSLCTSSHGGS